MLLKSRSDRERERTPHRWFAWFPVPTQESDSGIPDTVWLETVERRLVGYGCAWWWEYRRLAGNP